MEIEPHQADIYGLWADALDKKDLTAAERDEYGPMILGFRAIAEDHSPYELRQFHALVKQFERARARFARRLRARSARPHSRWA